MNGRELAISYIEECRRIHIAWAEGIESGDTWFHEPAPRREAGGDAEHHREWVRKYDHVLRVLRDSKGT